MLLDPLQTASTRPVRPRRPENFVDVLAWIFISLSGFATFIGIMQNLLLATVFPLDRMTASLTQAPLPQQFPPVAQFMFRHFQLFFLTALALSTVTLISAIGLLKRRNWARLLFIALLVLGIAWNLGGLAIQRQFLSVMPAIPPTAPPDFRAGFEAMTTVIQVFSALMTIGISVLFGWLIKRLVTPSVLAEFRPSRHPAATGATTQAGNEP